MQGKGREGLLQMELLCVCKRVCRVSLGEGVAFRLCVKLGGSGSLVAVAGHRGSLAHMTFTSLAGGMQVSPTSHSSRAVIPRPSPSNR